MVATARQIPITDDDLNPTGNAGGGAYAELEVPGDFEAVLKAVEDYDKRAEGKSQGWIFKYGVETPLGREVSFDVYLSFGDNARWKLIADLEVGLANIDPNSFVGDTIGVHIDFPRDKVTDEPTSYYREISSCFALADIPEVLEQVPEII